MRIPVSWLRELVDIPAELSGREIAELLVGVGFEVEGVETVGDVRGDLVVGRVANIEELTDFKKPIRWCQVEVGAAYGHPDTPGIRGIVCGARNFAEGDFVVVALAGTTLPGDFTIATRETYGHISDGMMCSARELGLGDEHDGIIILPSGEVGQSAYPILGLGEEVLDIAVTPDRGYALSLRGIAREVAIAQGIEFKDPGLELPVLPEPAGDAVAAVIEDEASDLLVLRTLDNFDPSAPTPDWMKARLAAVGVRSISLAVDVTNYVMFELGQPTHAYDADLIDQAIIVRRAVEGEKVETIDHVERDVDAHDLLIADKKGPLSIAGVMGGFSSEINDNTKRIVIEAAHFDPIEIAKASRRHKLSSEASRRFERGVDRMLAPVASARCAELLIEFGGARYLGSTGVENAPEPTVISFDPSLPSRVAGMVIDHANVRSSLLAVGCTITEGDVWTVRPASWRPDLTADIDLVEEVIRIIGYNNVPSTLPVAPRGRGLTHEQRLRRRAGSWLAGAGVTEVLNYPFVGQADFDALGLAADDSRRHALALANPLSDEQPLMRTTLLPGLLSSLARNVSRGFVDNALFESASVSLLRADQSPTGSENPPRPSVNGRPSASDIAELEALIPDQPRMLAIALSGALSPAGWWGSASPATWSDVIDLVFGLADDLGVKVDVANADYAPWHPGRCAALSIDGTVIGHAGELSPKVIESLGLPKRTVVAELLLDALLAAADVTPRAPRIWTFPIAKEDLALVVAKDVSASAVLNAIKIAGGELLEDVRLFDIYDGPQVAEGFKSLAFALRFRAQDRTLAADEVAAIRATILDVAAAQFNATLR